MSDDGQYDSHVDSPKDGLQRKQEKCKQEKEEAELTFGSHVATDNNETGINASTQTLQKKADTSQDLTAEENNVDNANYPRQSGDNATLGPERDIFEHEAAGKIQDPRLAKAGPDCHPENGDAIERGSDVPTGISGHPLHKEDIPTYASDGGAASASFSSSGEGKSDNRRDHNIKDQDTSTSTDHKNNVDNAKYPRQSGDSDLASKGPDCHPENGDAIERGSDVPSGISGHPLHKEDVIPTYASDGGAATASFSSSSEGKSDNKGDHNLKDQGASTSTDHKCMSVVFHLYVHHDAKKVILEFEKPLTLMQGNLSSVKMKCMSYRGYGKHWKSDPILLHPNDASKQRYTYTVKYHFSVRERLKRAVVSTQSNYTETYCEQQLFEGKNQYDVFHQPNNSDHEKWIFEGQFFFVTELLYRSIRGEKNLNEILIKVEHVGFGCTYCTSKEEESFFEWVNQVSASGRLTPYKSTYICSLLGQFYRHRNCSGFEARICEKASNVLLEELRCCPKLLLPQSSLDFIKCIHKKLLSASSYNSNLEYVWLFGELFDTDYVLRTASYISAVTSEDYINEIIFKLMGWLLRLEESQDQDKMIAFVISNAPTPFSLGTICQQLDNHLLPQAKRIVQKYKQFFTQERKPDVLDPAVWKATPRVLRPELAVPFCGALRKQVQETKEFNHRLLVEIILDKDLQKYASDDLLQLLKLLSKSTEINLLYAVCDVLNAHKFYLFWKSVKDEDKLDIVDSLLSSKLQSKINESMTNEERVVAAFQVTEELSKINILKKYEDVLEKRLHETTADRSGVQAIVDACDKIDRSTGAVGRKYYMNLLFKLVELHLESPDLMSKLMDTILTFSSRTPSSQGLSIDRGKETILLHVLDQADKHLLKLRTFEEFSKMRKAVLSERKLWTVIFQATGKVERLHKHRAYVTVKQVIEDIYKPFVDGRIPLNFIKDQKGQKDIAELLTLGRCFPPEVEKETLSADRLKELWIEKLASLSKEREEISKLFVHLERAINLANKITGEGSPIILQDVSIITKEYNALKSRFSKTEFVDARDANYWGHLDCLLKPSEKLSELSNCIIFKNFSRKLLEEQATSKGQTKADDQEEANIGHISMSVEEVLQILIKDGVKTFLDVFKIFTGNEGQVTSQELDRLLYGIQANNIKTEVESVCKILKLKGPSLEDIKRIQNFVQFDDVRRKIESAVKCLAAVGYTLKPEDSDSDFLQHLQSFLVSKDSVNLNSMLSQMENQQIIKLKHQLSPDLVDILNELSQATDLIDFIIETAKEDMTYLIEAVEEHSELIQETTVSYFIDVHRFLRGVLTNKPDNPEKFLDEIAKAYSNLKEDSLFNKRGRQQRNAGDIFHRETKMAAKIKVCSYIVHSLQGLHMMLANKGEMTKGIIKSAINYGRYRVETDQNGSIHVQLTYTRHDQNKSEAKYNLDDLNDLRSRALLIVNAEKRDRIADGQASPVISQQELRRFIEQVDLLTEIIHNYKILQMFGIPKYEKSFWKHLNSMEEIIEEEKRVEIEVENWKRMMNKARTDHFFLNYFHAKQLWIIKSFFHKQADGISDEVLSLFRCIDSSITRDDLPYFPAKYQKPNEAEEENELHAIGIALEEIFRLPLGAPLPVIDSPVKIDGIIEPGKLYVSVLEPGSVQTVHVVMALFQNTCARLPQPSQLLFCHSQTTWEDIELLLLRTFEAHRHGLTSQLHCIANVESLPNDIQFRLVDSLKTTTSDGHAPYLLAVVCRGGSHHYIADQFSDYVHRFGGIPDADLRKMFKHTCSETFLVTGDLPGLGKSELIYTNAAIKGNAVVTFPISGPFVRKVLVKRLSELKLKQFQSIHFDIGEVDDPASLDTFLFELIVTKMVSSETMLFSLPTDHVYIEIANTLQQGMRNSLPVCKCFKKLEVRWIDYSNLLSSKELTSPIQVVCQYLDAYDRGTLENQEVIFSGTKKAKALSPAECKAILKKHFFPGGDLSFNILDIFTSVLADQLMKFTRSPYFKPQHLKDMFEEIPAVRTRLFKALLDVATSFAARSINTCKATQANSLREVKARNALDELKSGGETTADQMVDRIKEMTQWTDNEHLVIMLHGAGAITAIYRDLKNVPQEVKNLFKSQSVCSEGLQDYTTMSQKDLQVRLERISDAPKNQDRSKLASLGYTLTPDNILKMALIIQRMQANIPVIVMGETGCGKTSLVRYLAQTCAIPFEVFSFHAGITESQIYDFIVAKDKEARNLKKEGKSMWVFMDEINTCDYLGTINEIVCHRSIYGKPLASNLMFVAACNPYRLRPPGRIMTAGLTGKTTMDEFSKLVYRVHPLPETMIDYVWDYGSLTPEDERTYIGRMVERAFDGEGGKMLVDLLAASQEFIRKEEQSSFCVSLRDVHRTTILMKWFYTTLTNRPPVNTKEFSSFIRKFFITAQQFDNTDKAVVLSLAHCYLSRLAISDSRLKYCSEMSKIFIKHGKKQFSNPSDSFQQIIRAEQEDYLSRMELPEGTAKNAALRENVFVILVCILNRIPVFVVGKPGCSKSLSMQVIRSNLRGRDSKDPFLKTLPQLFVVSFQGSESSTSEGISKVFEKARKYKSKSENVLPVVLLDEIGLAEISKFNPLKVLHRLLEPGEGEFPDVAVVGISNWALDAAKMNRAIHLSRPEPDVGDLHDTGLSIREAQTRASGGHLTRSTTSHIKCLAEAYCEYQSKQEHDNFHGLRDYYSMVKCLDNSSPNLEENNEKIQRAMQRNFGGISTGKRELQSTFLEKLKSRQLVGDIVEIPVTDLIRENLDDKMARHLMIISSGDSPIEILDQTLQDSYKEKITIFGSRFEEDLSADYNHRILSRIILCMEHNCILILRDLESIYGSLYDMLNQNYIIVGGKKNCRVALGAFSNPMCQVDDGFRCIVLVDENKVDYSDPPFLNRFEKQLLKFSDILNASQREMIKELGEWTESISTVEGHETEFDEQDMFAGFHEDTLPSIVLFHNQDLEMPKYDVIQRCKRDLMSIAMPEAVVRSRNSTLYQINYEEVNALYIDYFEKPIHDGLKAFLSQSFEALHNDKSVSGGMKLLVMTHSSIHTNVSKCIEGLFDVQVEKLTFFKSEKELSKRVKLFWMESSANLLVVQCRPETDAPHMLLVKTIIEENRKSFNDSFSQECDQRQKHVCIVIHLRRSVETEEDANHRCWQFNFLSGWNQVMIDTLEKPIISIKKMLEFSVSELQPSESFPFSVFAADQLLWCFTRIKSPPLTQLSPGEISSLVDTIKSSLEIMNCFMKLCCGWVEKELNAPNSGNKWQIDVACDRPILINSSTLVKALEYFISHLVRRPLAKIVYFLHKNSAWKALTAEDAETRQECLQLMSSKSVLNISDIQEPQDAESLVVDVVHPDLHFPFSCLFCRRVDTLYGFFCDEYRRQCLEKENLDENEELTKDARMILIRKVATKVEQVIEEIIDSHVLSQQLSDYVDDFLDIKTEGVSQSLSRHQRISIMKALYGDQLPTVPESEPNDVAYSIAQLHTTFWLNGNAFPELFYFIQACLSTNSIAIDGYVKRYCEKKEKAQEKENQAAVYDHQFAEARYAVEGRNCDAERFDASDEEDDRISEANQPLVPTFEECLVREVCLSLLPTDTFIETIGGIDEWKNVASLVLSSATKYCFPVPVFYYLKVCSDFANLVLPESTPYCMYVLGVLGKEVDDDSYLDSRQVFEDVCGLVQELRDEGQDGKSLDAFLFLFFERCIESNPGSPLMGEILRKITSSEDDHMLRLASSILHQIILNEEEAFSPENIENLITLSCSLDGFQNLMEINDVISEHVENGMKELDCHMSVICCDLINKLAFKDITIKELQSSDDPSMRSFHKAMDVVSQCDEECKKNMFGFICAVSFIRAFMSELSRLLSESGSTSCLEPVLNDVCMRLKDDEPPSRMTSVSTFLLKELGQKLCLYDVKHLIQNCEKLHPLRSLGWEDSDSTTKISYDPFQPLARKSKAETALGLYVADSDSKHLKNYLDSAMSSSKNRIEFAAVIAEQFYVARSISKLKDTEDNVAESVIEILPHLSNPYKNFIVRIAGQESFKCVELEISPESKAIDVEVAVLVQHLSAILTSGFAIKSKNPVMCCLLSPKVLKDSYVLAAPETTSGYFMYKHFKTVSYSKVALYSCECGIRFACDDKTPDRKCPCSRSLCEEILPSKMEKVESSKGYINCSLSALKNELLHVRNLDPIEFRILHFIVHSALFAGYSLGLSEDVLADVMKTANPSDTCYQIIQIDLDVLSNFMCCKKEKTITLMHHIFEEISPLLTEDAGLPLPHDEKARSTWEICFSEQVKSVIEKCRENGLCFTHEDQNAKATMESIIEERTLAHFPDVGSRNVCIPRLFRTTQPNTLRKLQDVYMNSPNEVKDKYPLLGLFLDYHETLQLIANLAPLISWSRRVDVLLTRALTRSEASKMKIVEVFKIKEQQLQQVDIQTATGDLAREEFEKFRKAWKNIVPLINAKLQESDEMPYISEMDPVVYCLAERQDLGRYLCTGLIVLAEMQNEFLDKCLSIATSRNCSALQFLFKDLFCCLQTVQVQDVKEKEIIQYEWTDSFLGHSLYATEYGQGKNIMYDMGKIEKDMAGSFLLGKPYLSTEQGIREFVFSKQLFHDCADILNELNEAIPQEKIPSSVEAELGSSATKSMDRVQILLVDLELVLCYLKRNRGKPEESLVDYVDTWMSSSRPFPKDLFPKTLKAIQVKHVCALYEFVEDQLAVPFVECVSKEYRKSMPVDTEKQMTQISKDEGKFVLEAIVVAIRRFVFRYLRMKPHPDECLVKFMKDPSLWPMALRSQHDSNIFKVPEAATKFFPKEVQIGHVYEVYTLYQKRIEEIKAKEAPSNIFGTTSVPRPQPGARHKKKRGHKAGGYA